MVRGSTPTHTFTLPFAPPQGTEFRIVYAQGEDYKEKNLFEITTERCTIDGKAVRVKLTQEETLLFDCAPVWHNGQYAPLPVKIQIGCKTPGGETLWSNIINTTADRCLKEDGAV